MKVDMAKADPFLESKLRDIYVTCARCRTAVVCHMCGGYVIDIDECAGCLRDTEVMKNTAEI